MRSIFVQATKRSTPPPSPGHLPAFLAAAAFRAPPTAAAGTTPYTPAPYRPHRQSPFRSFHTPPVPAPHRLLAIRRRLLHLQFPAVSAFRPFRFQDIAIASSSFSHRLAAPPPHLRCGGGGLPLPFAGLPHLTPAAALWWSAIGHQTPRAAPACHRSRNPLAAPCAASAQRNLSSLIQNFIFV